MKVRDTSPGRLYALSSEIGCVAINGAMAVDIPAGGQVVVLALDKKIVIDGDDDAKFVEVRWGTNTVVGSRPVPAWLSDVLSGLISIAGDDKFDISYMPAENKLVVHTDRVDDEQLAAVTDMLERFVPQFIEVIQYNHNMEISWRDIDRYADCTNIRELKARAKEYGFTRFGQDLPPSGELCYNLKNVKEIGTDEVEWPYLRNQNLKKVSSDMPLLTNPYFAFRDSGVTEYTGNLDGCTGLYFAFSGCTKLSKWRTRLPKLNTQASVAFGGCILDKQSVLIICESIPAYTSGTYQLGIGIHVDHKTDEEVLAAIDAATAKGWTLTVQWNGTSTSGVSTLDLVEIYAKVNVLDDEHAQYGEYTDENGNRCSLDWGHIITSPDGKTPEEMGYVCFYSLYEAEDYFNLTRVEANPLEDESLETGN